MTDDSAAADLAERLSNSCIRIVLGLLLFASVAFGLSGQLGHLHGLTPLGQYVLARENLKFAVAEMKADPCLEGFAAKQLNSSLDQVTLRELMEARCEIGSDSPAAKPAATVTPATVAPTGAGVATVADTVQAVPNAPTGVSISFSVGLYEAEIALAALDTLWDLSALEPLKRQSNVIALEIFRVEAARYRASLSASRRPPQAPVQGWKHPEIANLTLAEIEAISTTPGMTMGEFDRLAGDVYKTALPDSPNSMTLRAAADVTAFVIAILLIALAAFVRAASRANAFAAAGTIFTVLSGAWWLDVFVVGVISAPVACLGLLVGATRTVAIDTRVPVAAMVISTVATAYVLWLAFEHSRARVLVKRWLFRGG